MILVLTDGTVISESTTSTEVNIHHDKLAQNCRGGLQ